MKKIYTIVDVIETCEYGGKYHHHRLRDEKEKELYLVDIFINGVIDSDETGANMSDEEYSEYLRSFVGKKIECELTPLVYTTDNEKLID